MMTREESNDVWKIIGLVMGMLFLALFLVSYFVAQSCRSVMGSPEEIAPNVYLYTEVGRTCTTTWEWKL